MGFYKNINRNKKRKINKIEKKGKFNYIREDGTLISNTWFDYVYNFNESIGLGKVVLNDKINFINNNGILVSKWKLKVSKFYPGKMEQYNIPNNLFRISRLENLKSIIDLGILSRKLSRKYLEFENNSYNNIQDRRAQFGKYNLHEYVPLFFSKYPAMMYSTKIRENIFNQIILVFNGDLLLKKEVIFSDISLAYQDISENNIFDNLEKLKNIDFGIFEKKGWENDINIRKKKGAEVLVKKRIDFIGVKEIIYFDESKKEEIEGILKENGFNIKITYNNYEDYKG